MASGGGYLRIERGRHEILSISFLNGRNRYFGEKLLFNNFSK
jgi:hypothetical protein